MTSEERSDKLLALVERIAIALEGGSRPTLPVISPSKDEKLCPNPPPCPICKGPTRLRTKRDDGSKFWGCAKFPVCKGTCNADGTPTVRKTSLTKESSNAPDLLLDEETPF
jgi:hypothetical protein